MARIYKRGKIYYVDYRVDGKRIRKRVGSNKKLAEAVLKDIEVRIFKGELRPPKPRKQIEEFITEFLNSYEATTKPRTYTRYRAVMDHFRKFLQGQSNLVSLIQITPHNIEKYKLERLQCVTHNTANFELGVLRTFFNQAKEFGFIKDNPVKNVKKIRTSRKPPRFFSKEELKAIFDHCDDFERALYSTLLYTGIRRGELQFLEWHDINLEEGVIKIQVKDYWEPKSRVSREIPVHENLIRILKEHKKRYGENRWVFSKPNGDQLDHLWRRFQGILKRAEINNATVHTFRHTFASHLVMAGVDLPTVQKFLGHSDIATTMIYAHLAPDHLMNSISKLQL